MKKLKVQNIVCEVESLDHKDGDLTIVNFVDAVPHILPTAEAKALLGEGDYELHQLFYGGILYEAVK